MSDHRMDEPELEEYWSDVRIQRPKTYVGSRTSDGAGVVYVEEPGKRRRKLPLGLNVIRHSPTGFGWSYAGSGPAQLAAAILLDAYRHKGKEWIIRNHQEFKRLVISKLPHDKWTLTIEEVRKIVEQIEG